MKEDQYTEEGMQEEAEVLYRRMTAFVTRLYLELGQVFRSGRCALST